MVAALDLQPVGEGPDAWIVHVLGVYNDGRDVWMQVARDAAGTGGVVLRLSLHATVRHALAALASPVPTDSHPHVVSVMRAVGTD
jgi:hypothetical protein